jgi:hypothetical protein
MEITLNFDLNFDGIDELSDEDLYDAIGEIIKTGLEACGGGSIDDLAMHYGK